MSDPAINTTMLGPMGSGPYGPCTPRVRRFLVLLAGLGTEARAEVVRHHAASVLTRRYHAADVLLGDTIARAGREDVRDALAGPLFQLVQRPSGMGTTDTVSQHEDPLDALDAVAEPALAAAMALLVSDLLPFETLRELYAPFDTVIPLAVESH